MYMASYQYEPAHVASSRFYNQRICHKYHTQKVSLLYELLNGALILIHSQSILHKIHTYMAYRQCETAHESSSWLRD